ncbi:MAG: metallophosphoesterase family protein [Gemmatimonadaceae bacterium]
MNAAGDVPANGVHSLRILQVGDLHFASRARPVLAAALEDLLARERYDVVAFCGDFAQRARIGEFLCGAAIVRYARQYGATIAVPGNHDVAWWRSPMHLFGAEQITRKYRTWFQPELEPRLKVSGATFVGLNTAHGVAPYTLTPRLRDVSIIGAVTSEQLARCSAALGRIPAGDLRAVVMHHNPVRGELSRRFGITNHRAVLSALADARCELVLCGHDHQERVEAVEQKNNGAAPHTILVSVCGTLSSRSRGGRPCSVTAITVNQHQIAFQFLMENAVSSALEPQERFVFPRPTQSSIAR